MPDPHARMTGKPAIVTTGIHPVVLVPSLIGCMLAIALTVFILALPWIDLAAFRFMSPAILSRLQAGLHSPWMAAHFKWVAVGGASVFCWLAIGLWQRNWMRKCFVVSIEGDILTIDSGVLNATRESIALSRIEGVLVEQTMTGSILDFGDVVVRGIGVPAIRLLTLARPNDFSAEILARSRTLRTGGIS